MKKYPLLLGSKITSYWLLVKKRIFLEQVVQDLEQVVQEKISAFQALVLGTLSRFLEQPVQVIYLLIFYVNIFHHINIGGKSLYISHII